MRNLRFIISLFVITILTFSDLFAIPAFARKYNLSCQTCHSPIPKLKTFGDEFAANGFRMPEMESTRYFTDTGDDRLSLIRELPLAIRFDLNLGYKTGDDSKGLDFQSVYILKLLSGGELSSNISYYFYFYMSEKGEIVGIEDAYLIFNNLFDYNLDLYVGQFQVSDPLFKREIRLTLEDYQVYKTNVGNSTASLAYDRGVMLTLGLESGTNLVFEVVNGNGIGVADEMNNFDDDSFKNFFGRVSQNIGDFLRVGAFGYFAKEEIEDAFFSKLDDKISMWGPDLTLGNDKIELNFQYSWRKDSRAFHNIIYENVKTQGAFAELIYRPLGDESKWYAVGLFNWVDSDFDMLDYQSMALHAGYLLRRNIRMITEYKYDFKQKYNLFSVGIVSAF